MPEPEQPLPSPPREPRPLDGNPDVEKEPAISGPEHSHVNAAASGALDSVSGRRRPARYGLLVQFESRPDDSELGRPVDSTLWINDAHPADARAVASRSLGYHTALAVALALAPLAVGGRDEHAFLTQFLAQWGGAQASTRGSRSKRTKN